MSITRMLLKFARAKKSPAARIKFISFRLLYEPYMNFCQVKYKNANGRKKVKTIPLARMHLAIQHAERENNIVRKGHDFIIKDFCYQKSVLYSGELRIDTLIFPLFKEAAQVAYYNHQLDKGRSSSLVQWKRVEPEINPFATEEVPEVLIDEY